ncbi:putative ribonuclease H-like domain-containing protein [Tanacetum coccineum]
MKRVNTFVAMGYEVQENKEKKEEGREETTKGSRKKMLRRKRAVKERQEESSKKQKVEEEKESEEVEEDDEVELKKLLVIKKDEDIAIDAIPLATKFPVIINYKLHKKGMLVHYELIRADGSSKRYSSMIRMLQGIDREYLEALWRIVKAKVTTWKLIDSSGVHFVRFDNLHIFMLVERRYPLTPITITNMLNKKLQTDHQTKMCNQLLKLMMMNIKFRGGLLGLKRLHGFLEVTVAQVHNGNYAKCPTPTTKIHKDHPLEQIIGDIHSAPQTRKMTKNVTEHEEPKKVIQALKDPSWIEAMQEELLQFKLQQVWSLMDLPHGKRAIGTKWVYMNKKDERGIVIRNKASLVAQGYTQEEGINYDEVTPVAMIEAIRLFLAYTSFKDFVVYQMDVKSAFLYGKIEEEVYSLIRATYLLDNGFQRGQIDKTLLIKRVKGDILLVQVYVDDIIFGSIKKGLCNEFEKLMHKKFQMSYMGELTFFLGLQMTQNDDGIFISQDKYVDEILKKFGFLIVKTTSTPMETSKPLVKDAKAKDVNVHLYRSMIGSLMYLTASRPDIMFVVCACARFQVTPKVSHLHAVKRIFRYLKDMKSTTGGCQFPRRRLISWKCNKQTIVANSTTEAEYVAASSCCGQVLWIQNQMLDYGYNFMNTKIFIDNKSTICIVKNPVFHSKTKHIEIRHHFIRDSYDKRLIQVIKIYTDHNVADLLTKAFNTQKPRKAKSPTEISQSSRPIPLVAHETIIKEWEDRMERAATTTSSLEVEQDSGSGPRCQDTILGGVEAQIRFEAASKQSNDPPLSRVNTLRSGEDIMKLKELMEFCTKLSKRALDL